MAGAGGSFIPRGTKVSLKNKLLAISGVRPVGPTVRRLTTDQEIPGSNPGQDYHPQIFLVSLLSWFNNQMDRQP